MDKRVERKPGVIRLYGNSSAQPKPKPRPAPRRPERKPIAKPPPLVRNRAAPVPAKATAPSQPMVALSPHSQGSNGTGQAKYTTSRFCQCDKPLVIADREINRFDVAIESRCLRCGKSRGGANAPDNHPESSLPDELA